MKILILGISGMLGNALYRYFTSCPGIETYGTSRSSSCLGFFNQKGQENIISNVDVERSDSLLKVMNTVKPDVVINCIGVVKQLKQAYEPLESIPINSILPHRLAEVCRAFKARLIHISTDCVFSGNKGFYKESDLPDATDLYGRSKLLGEVNYPHAITLRTSIIGHELTGARSLVDWFLAQQSRVKGFTKAVFSGFPTIEIARIIHEYVLPQPKLNGLYHVAAEPINKFDLLTMVKAVYKTDIDIEPSEELVIDRSLDAENFNSATGYAPPSWLDLIELMYSSRPSKG